MMALRVPAANHPVLEDFQVQGRRNLCYGNLFADELGVRDATLETKVRYNELHRSQTKNAPPVAAAWGVAFLRCLLAPGSPWGWSQTFPRRKPNSASSIPSRAAALGVRPSSLAYRMNSAQFLCEMAASGRCWV